MEQYLSMLKDSLLKKEKILIDLLSKSDEQGELVKKDDVDWERFGELVDEKGRLIEELSKLDDGFGLLYERIKEELKNNKDKYASEIRELQVLIKSVTEKSTDLQAKEARNKSAIETAFSKTRNEIKQSKMSQKAAMSYYNKMNKINTIDPQMLDRNC